MKVLRTGYLLYDRHRLTIIGWRFDCEGKNIDIDEMLEAIFDHIKKDTTIGLDSNQFANTKKE